jgi:uncharacterized protein
LNGIKNPLHQNSRNAQWNLGLLYYRSKGVKRGKEKADEWFKKSYENDVEDESCERDIKVNKMGFNLD